MNNCTKQFIFTRVKRFCQQFVCFITYLHQKYIYSDLPHSQLRVLPNPFTAGPDYIWLYFKIVYLYFKIQPSNSLMVRDFVIFAGRACILCSAKQKAVTAVTAFWFYRAVLIFVLDRWRLMRLLHAPLGDTLLYLAIVSHGEVMADMSAGVPATRQVSLVRRPPAQRGLCPQLRRILARCLRLPVSVRSSVRRQAPSLATVQSRSSVVRSDRQWHFSCWSVGEYFSSFVEVTSAISASNDEK